MTRGARYYKPDPPAALAPANTLSQQMWVHLVPGQLKIGQEPLLRMSPTNKSLRDWKFNGKVRDDLSPNQKVQFDKMVNSLRANPGLVGKKVATSPLSDGTDWEHLIIIRLSKPGTRPMEYISMWIRGAWLKPAVVAPTHQDDWDSV